MDYSFKIINLSDFKPEKLSTETKNNSNNNIKIHHVRYENWWFLFNNR